MAKRVRPLAASGLRTAPRAVRLAGFLAVALPLALFVASCGKQEPKTDAEKGRTLYSLHCTACHNPDPSKDGSLGPSVQGASLELLTARIVHGEYPPGYAPKRPTKIMQKLPLQPDDIKALHAFLNGM